MINNKANNRINVPPIEKYTYRVEWSEEDQTHLARCLEFPSLIAHGKTPAKALAEIEKVVAFSIQWMLEEHEPIPEPFGLQKYKGNLSLRVPVELHRQLVINSTEEGVLLNQYILSKIS